jgi:class 3 adenylate cyclase
MEQEIRFCTTSDGIRIAYATVGEGPPLLVVPGWLSHLNYTCEQARAFWEGLARGRRVVRYDGRGMGLSDRDVDDLSFDARVRDIEGVAATLGDEPCDVMGMSEGGPLSAAFAVRHPEKVRRLILYGTYPRAPVKSGDAQALLPLIRGQWGMGSAALTSVFVPHSGPEEAEAFTRLQRVAASGEVAARTLEEILKTDVTGILGSLARPTLIVHRRGDRIHPLELAREMAALIPGAQFVLLEGDAHPPWVGDSASVLKAITAFLGGLAFEEAAAQKRHSAEQLVIVLFTDIAGSTALTQRLGDERAQELVRAHNSIVRDALRSHGGSEIKHTGDGIMASFPSASGALDCASAIQRSMEQGTRNMALPQPIEVRIGLNAGEPVAEEGDLYGTAVQLAKRICDQAGAGEILVSNVVRELAAGKPFMFADRGAAPLKGFGDPVRLFQLRWRDGRTD